MGSLLLPPEKNLVCLSTPANEYSDANAHTRVYAHDYDYARAHHGKREDGLNRLAFLDEDSDMPAEELDADIDANDRESGRRSC